VFNYYALQMRRQRAIELRCWVRKAAINKFWATQDQRVFSERTICQIEAKDKRMALVQSAEALWPEYEKMEWRGEFLRRTQLEARMTKTHISWLVPA
jgi:homoaconitase/3-isopropylmalate dehydratase large subunit